MDVKERASWIISDIIKKKRLSNKKLSEILDCGTGTINNYRRQNNIPGSDFVEKLYKKFNVSPVWFITGQGEPYTGDNQHKSHKKTDYNNEEEVEEEQAQPTPARPDANTSQCDFKISETLAMTARVLESETTYANALYLNIVHFNRAIDAESKISALEKRMDQFETQDVRLTLLESHVVKISAENAELKKENEEIKKRVTDKETAPAKKLAANGN